VWAAAHEREKEDNVDYEQLKIKSYKHWDLYFHENQCYLGRTFVQLKEEEGIDDFLSIDGEVRHEFFSIGQSMKTALKTLFQPDKMMTLQPFSKHSEHNPHSSFLQNL
jgi:diadenosine tetraphosphate (Ap4A) HIT family hydrolase